MSSLAPPFIAPPRIAHSLGTLPREHDLRPAKGAAVHECEPGKVHRSAKPLVHAGPVRRQQLQAAAHDDAGHARQQS